MTAFFLSLLVVFSSSGAPLLQRPNLSGEWELQTPAPAPPELARVLRVVQGGRDISVTRSSDKVPTTQTHSFGHSGTVGPPGARQSSGLSVWWFGDALRFDQYSRSLDADGSEKMVERNEVWSLDEQGLLTIEVTVRRSGAPPSRVTGAYRRVKHR